MTETTQERLISTHDTDNETRSFISKESEPESWVAFCRHNGDEEAIAAQLVHRWNMHAKLLEAARPFALTSWLSSGVLISERTDNLMARITIEGADYEAEITVGQIRALAKVIAEAEGSTNDN